MSKITAVLCAFAALLLSFADINAQPQYLTAKPMSQIVRGSLQPVRSATSFPLFTIKWGADVATVYGATKGIFTSHGLNVELFNEDNPVKQVERCLAGETPYVRFTVGMAKAAADALKAQGIDLVPVVQLTWSVGGDCMVARKHIRTPADLRGKTIALQLYGPHMDYVASILRNAGISLNQVTFKWLEELTLPKEDTGGRIIDPVSTFQSDPSIDAVMCIIPDGLMLTSGGKVGTGAEGSVAGAHILMSSKTASRIIADVYAVRSDYLESNRYNVEQFVNAMLASQEGFRELLANKARRQTEYSQLLSKAADVLFSSPLATGDVEAMIPDCEFVGFDGNVDFFTGRGTTRNLDNINRELQVSFKAMGLLASSADLPNPGLNYATVAKGLKYASPVTGAATAPAQPAKKMFDEQKVAKAVERRIAAEPTKWEEEGTLFIVEFKFDPNQSTFEEAKYADDFRKALEISQTYGGSLIAVEGHADPLGVREARKAASQSQSPADIAYANQIEQQAKNLSLTRAEEARRCYITYCKKHGFTIDESRFVAVGMGIKTPKFNPPRTEDEWKQNRRVVFRIKQVEAELSEFTPIE